LGANFYWSPLTSIHAQCTATSSAQRTSIQTAANVCYPPNAAICASRSICHFGLLAAVSRIAAIQSNDLAPTNMNGPNRTFTSAQIKLMRFSNADLDA
jgi:hypothetical protein